MSAVMPFGKLKPVDQKILDLLFHDSRMPFAEIGRAVGLSESAVRRRVKNLVDSGVIRRFTIEVERGQGAQAMILVSANPATSTPKVSKTMRGIRGVEVVYEITGQYDVAAILSAPNIAEINRAIDEIRQVDGVSSTNTVIILRMIR